MNRRHMKSLGMLLLSFSIAGVSGCGGADTNNAGTQGTQQSQQANQAPNTQQQSLNSPQTASGSSSASGSMQARSSQQGATINSANGSGDAVIASESINGASYIPLRKLTDILELQTEWDATSQTMRMGENDFPFELTNNSTKAVKDGDPVTLPAPPVMKDGSMYVPLSAVVDLFRQDMNAEVRDGQLIVHPSPEQVEPLNESDDAGQTTASGAGQDADGLDFGEDPNDPFRTADTNPNAEAGKPSAASGDQAEIPVLAEDFDLEPLVLAAAAKNIDINGLIARGKRYMGVKYQFGARPYAQSGRFDCSTFTQYLFGHYGVKLPRVARQQARIGTTVARKNLRRGDLMYFYVPGRFKANKTVGHVGIYIGNNQMLHASPKPKNGVQITNINKAYWKRTYLYAKRVAY
ncbi:NlpC/P60 family protein [Paenibacillus chartarius]|uniref:NlpC/P60 family protein n=1 Tax=Paenibacillus chartarius TaxID=747481 RepID=A0ABV6DN62_9BACL